MGKSPSLEFIQELTLVQRRLYAYILTLVPNRAEAEDILQEANMVLCRKSCEYDPKLNFQGWAYRISRYQVMAYLKKRKRENLLISGDIVDLLAEEIEDTSRFDLMRNALSFCMENLTEKSRKVARLRFESNLPLAEIANKLGKPIGTISATLYRIRKNLALCVRKKLAEDEAAETA